MTGIELIIGAVLPPLLEIINRYVKSTKGKFIVSLLVPLFAGAALTFQQLSFVDPETALASGAVIFAAAQGVYKLYFRDSKIQRVLAK